MSDEARWLNDAELETWLAVIGMVTRLPNELDQQLRRDAHMSHFEYGVLAALEHAEDATRRMSDLAYVCHGSLSRLSHVVRRLEEQNLIERFACPDDGRSTLARLTDDGRRRLAKAAPGHVELVRSLIFDELSEEEAKEYGRLTRRILDRITK
ncbi:MarR family winged helix-turn-helix transcriptional regulator [Glycomyces buryatensis]|uniref:MarR family transcriptional regulator n=1 Tax=Glycomyces buryatensis TaxID=2570927 RepID=A0A4S8Q8T7_9ACTN|nr:MarR family transcriptional regulator [Glycomyces buryatensis]THV40817.1 MarR family transcriptional regulator [Glycomyces buryatensis]